MVNSSSERNVKRTCSQPEASASSGEILNAQHRAVPIQKFGADQAATDDFVTVEEPLEIRIRYYEEGQIHESSLSVTMRTPGDDTDLACGFLLTEGIITGYDQIQAVTNKTQNDGGANADNVVIIQLEESTRFNPDSLLRHFYTSSSCGVCGKVSLASVNVHVPEHAPAKFAISAARIELLPQLLRKKQVEFSRTGGLHASALFDSQANILKIREDIGRHNALDKLIGSFRDSGLSTLRSSGLLLSGRASFELLQKAAIAGIPLVASIGPPSSLAIELARDQEITLVGFLREKTFNLYHGERVVCD